MTQSIVISVLTTVTLALASPVFAGSENDFPAAELQRVLEQRLAGKSADAIATLTTHPAVLAKKPQALALLALCQIDENLNKEADQTLGSIIKPYVGDDWATLQAFGITLVMAGEYRRGVIYLRRAEAADPEKGESEFARLYSEVASFPQAKRLEPLAAFDRVDQVPPQLYSRLTANAYFSVARGMLERGDTSPECEDLLNKARALQPSDPNISLTLANLQIARGNLEGATATADLMERNFESRMEEVMYIRGILADRAGDKVKALEHLNDAITLSQRAHIAALIEAASISMDLDRYYEARLHLDRAIALAPSDFAARAQFARYNLYRAETTDNPSDEGLYLRAAEEHCLFAKVRQPYDVSNLERLEKVYVRMKARGNNKVDLDGVRQDLRVARLKETGKVNRAH